MPPRPKNKKSLAEELAELANPAPLTDIDPDADIFQSGPTLEGSDDELMDAVHQSNNRPATRSFKRAAAAAVDIILEGPDYAGKKSSSKAIFGDEDSEEEEEEEEEEESDIEDELHQNGMKGLHKQTANSSSDDDDDGDDDDGQEEDDEMARLEREYREMQAAETSTVKQLQDRVCKERRKAVAVSNQTNLWKKALEARILLQKALAGGNRFPRGSAYTIAVEHSEKAGDALKSLASEASETLSSVCDVLEALMQRNPAVAGAHAAAGVQGGGEGGSKRKRDDNEEDEDDASDKGWKRLEGCYKDMQPFRDSSIDRWHRKTVLQTGTAAVHGNLRVLNQSVSTQIATLMADPTRLVQRTRMVKGSVKTLCEPAAVVMNNNNKVSSSMSDGCLLL
jgi:protein AATF/BFR2